MPDDLAFPLRAGRVHEVCGPAATAFAAIAGARTKGGLLWICESWQLPVLNPLGLAGFLDPSRVLVAQAKTQIDALAVAEEALKDGVVSLVVLEISQVLDLREGRRLQLAARAGGTTGLCLIPEGMGSNAAETRWHAAPVFDPADDPDDLGDSTRMRWELTKNKSGTFGVWHVRWDAEAHRLDVVSAPGQRPGPAGAPG